MDNSSAKPVLPKVSVIICVYNNSQYLHEAIKSAVSQDYPNIDVWVVDDASTEDLQMKYSSLEDMDHYLYERIDEIESHDRFDFSNASQQRIKLYYLRLKKNGGPSVARNIAIANAARNGSHLFQILDSDDIMYPTKVGELIKPILLDPERVAISYADYHIRNEAGTVRYESKLPWDYIDLFMRGNCTIHSGSLFSGLAIQHLMPKPYPEEQRVCEDFFLWRSVLRNNRWVAIHTAKPLTLVRSHSGDSTSSVRKDIWERDFQRTMQLS